MVALNHVRSAERASPPVSFEAVNRLALANASGVVAAMLAGGRRVGGEWVARNPRRADKSPGSFKVNLATGRWADFATGDRGSDLVSLAAYLAGCSQYEAAKRLGDALGLVAL
jgi:hypothetical protein